MVFDFLITFSKITIQFAGILNNFLAHRNHNTDSVGQKIAVLLKDDNHNVRMKAALALGYFFGDL